MIITDDKDKIIEAYKKEQVEYTNKFIDMQEIIEYLEKEKDRLGSLFYERNEENIKLHHIIKEAREYIESYLPNYDFDKTNLITLLEILQGSDKE